MAHIAPHHGFFTADFTYFGHDYSPLDIKKTNIKTISSTLNASGCKELFLIGTVCKKIPAFAGIGLNAVRFNFSNLKSSDRLKMWSGPV
jgi:hypothetical protein